VGRSLLRNTIFYRFVRDTHDNSEWSHLPQSDGAEELRHLNTWPEEDEEYFEE
jgi:hypothetical protein